MPELPEVETTCSGIRPHLLNHSVCNVNVRESRLRWPVSLEIENLSNTKVLEVTRRAKYLFIKFKEGTIIAHLGMSGSLRICEEESELKKHDHLIFTLSSGKQMRYHDPRRFGCMLWSTNPDKHELIKKLGPEPLDEEAFSEAYFFEKSQNSSSQIKQFIMNNSIVVGVGNIYACESLHLSGISPKRKANSISRKRILNLRENIRNTLAKAIEQGGTTLRDFVNHEGNPGYFQQTLHVYDREGKPCKQCSSSIKRITQGQRSTFYCSGCQR